MTSKIDRYFFIAAILFALAGFVLGIVMGASQDFSLHPLHAHINLVGWVTLALFGIGYRIDFAAKDKLAVVQFFLAVIGTLVFTVGIYFANTAGNIGGAIAGSLITLAALLLFLVNVLRRRV